MTGPSTYWHLFVDAERAHARLPLAQETEHYRLLRTLRTELGAVAGWSTDLVFELQVDELTDFLHCSQAPPAVSRGARAVIEPLLGPADDVLWLPVTVERQDGERVEMYFIRPLHGPDLVDEEASHRGPGIPPGTTSITVAVFDRAKIGDRQLFAYAYGTHPVVSHRIRAAIESAELTGIEQWAPVRSA